MAEEKAPQVEEIQASQKAEEKAPQKKEAKQPVEQNKAPTKKAPQQKDQAPKPSDNSEKESEAPQKAAKPKPTSHILAFNEWDAAGITVEDEGLIAYITLEPTIVPKTGARYAGNRFHKSKVFIVERLINKLMVVGHKGKKHTRSSGHNTGRAAKVYDIVREAFRIIEKKLNKNPIAVFVQAIERAAPREEIVNIEYGGARYPKAVECAPQRRVDIVLRQIAQGTYSRSFNKKRSASECLAEEILFAYQGSNQSQAIQKKVDLERAADSSR